MNKINIELYQKLINEILGSSKVTKSDQIRDPQKQGLGQAFTQGPKIDQFLTNLIKQTSKYKNITTILKLNLNFY